MRPPLTEVQRDLVAAHEALPRKIAATMLLPAHLRDEAPSAGYVGLCEAAQDFDPGRGLKFNTFARHRIRGAIQDWLRGLSGVRGGRARPPRMEALAGRDVPGTATADLLEVQDEWRAVLRRLPGVHARALHRWAMCLHAGLTVAEDAFADDVTVYAVWQRRNRALAAARGLAERTRAAG